MDLFKTEQVLTTLVPQVIFCVLENAVLPTLGRLKTMQAFVAERLLLVLVLHKDLVAESFIWVILLHHTTKKRRKVQ